MRTVFVLVTDERYFDRARRTLIDLRTRGQWAGEVVMIPVGFRLNKNFRDFYRITEVIFPPIENKEALLEFSHIDRFPTPSTGER